MGKSDKKIKSDRINALRKQYDAFVEEDKKRKERNQYILGRLDKMRYCTTLVPVRHKTLPSINRSSVTYLGYQPEVPMARDFQTPVSSKNQINPDIPIPKIDDQYVISEISKNYILIPKLRSSFMPNYTNPNNTDIMEDIRDVQQLNQSNMPNVISNENNDWKNKYEILNILRNEEGKQTAQLVNKNVPVSIINKDIRLDNTKVNAVLSHIEIMPNTKSELEYKYLDDLPEKDTLIDKRNYELRGNDEAFDNTGTYAINSVSNTADDTIADIDYKLQNTNLENNYFESSDPNVLSEDTNYVEQEYYAEPTVHEPLGEQTHYVKYTEPVTNDEQNIGINPNEYIRENSEKIERNIEIIQVTNSSEVREEINDDQTALESESLDYIQYETENTKVQELQPNFGLQLKRVDETEQKISTAETDLDVAAQQQPHVEVIQQQQPHMEVIPQFIDGAELQQQFVEETQQFLDETQQQQLFVDETPQQLIVEGTQQEQYFEGAQQQQQYVDGARQQYIDGAQQQYVDGSQQQYTSNEEKQQQPTRENITENPSNIEDVDNIASIEAFDAEQREMFYSDNQPQQYQYEQPNANVYDQGYPQNVSYQEDQDYPNYENVDQTYNPVNLGENEEQTLRYDQAYQQQYVDPYEKAYEKNEEPSQVYEDIQQTEMEHIEQMQYQGYNKEQVETTLDSEEGITQGNKAGITEAQPLTKTN